MLPFYCSFLLFAAACATARDLFGAESATETDFVREETYRLDLTDSLSTEATH